jgi:short-subunit dehydrogenase
MGRAILVGASSGIGRELAKVMAADGWVLGLASRNGDALETLRSELGEGHRVQVLDVTHPEEAAGRLEALAAEMGDVDCVILSSGIGVENRKLQWEPEARTLATNVTGFAACASWAGRYFLQRKRGQIVGISSVAGLRGSPFNPAYNASKAFVSNYLEGLRLNLGRYEVAVTDVRPGYVNTPMTEGQKGMFWVSDARTAARQTYDAIRKRRSVAYVTRRWKWVALLSRNAPDFLYRRFSN